MHSEGEPHIYQLKQLTNTLYQLLTDVTANQDYDHLAISLIAHLTSGQELTENPDTAIELVPIVLRMLKRQQSTVEIRSKSVTRVGFAYYTLLNITAVQCDVQDQQRVYNAVFQADGLLDFMTKRLNGRCEDESSYYVMGALANLCRTWKKDNLQAIGQYPRLMDAIKKSIDQYPDVEEIAGEFLLANLAGGGPDMLQLIIDSGILEYISKWYYVVKDKDDKIEVFEDNKLSKVYVAFVNAICSALPGDQMQYLLNEKSKCVQLIFCDCILDEELCEEYTLRRKQVKEVITGVIVKTIGNESQRAAVVNFFETNWDKLITFVDAEYPPVWLEAYQRGGIDGFVKLEGIFKRSASGLDTESLHSEAAAACLTSMSVDHVGEAPAPAIASDGATEEALVPTSEEAPDVVSERVLSDAAEATGEAEGTL